MNPESELVTQLSRWLSGHLGDAELLELIASVGRESLSLEQSQALDELVEELNRPHRHPAQLQMVGRETLETLALG